MRFELDHIFLMTAMDSPSGDRLIKSGLVEGSSNIHPGQGTANRRFFFRNAMVELLWVHNPAEAQSEITEKMRLWERWQGRENPQICPFGICLRSVEKSGAIAFPTWDYRPAYLPPNLSIFVGTNSDILSEPMLFQTPFGKRPDQFSAEKAQPLDHPSGLREVTRLELVMPNIENLSPVMQAVIATGQIHLRQGEQFCLNLIFDDQRQNQTIDLRPALPLVILG